MEKSNRIDTEQVKDAGLVELYNELSEDLKTIPQ